MWRGLLFFAVLSLPPASGVACSIEGRASGEPFDVPATVVEVRVLEVSDEPYEYRPNRFENGQRAKFEVKQSLLGSMPVSATFEMRYPTSGCFGHRLRPDSRVLVADFEADGNLAFYEVVMAGETFASVHGRFADATRAWRTSARPKLARVRLSGDIDEAVADRLLQHSALQSSDASCDIALDGEYAQVTCGDSTAGDGMRPRVIFENLDGEWLEVLRWPTSAR